MDRVCTHCGCSSFHYNRRRMRMECDSCGAPAGDPQEEQQLMQYDRTYARAMSNLAAGNWGQTIELLTPLTRQYPTEKKLYLAILRAATQDFGNMDVKAPVFRNAASDAWNKLVRLNGVTGGMIRYGRLRYEARRKQLAGQRTRILAWILAAAACLAIAGTAFGTRHYFAAVFCLFGVAGCLYMAYSHHPVTVLKQLMSDAPDYRQNPFV